MALRRYLVFDIETIWDRALMRQVFGTPPDAGLDALREQVNAKYSGGFPPPPFHMPVCVALIDVDAASCKVHNAAVLDTGDERTLLQQFWKLVKFRKGNQPVKSTLVHYNGRGFDLPVLFYRSLKHRVPVVVAEDRSRYSLEFSHDICDDISDFGASSRPSLNLMAKLIGQPGKTETHGGMVEDLYEQGERARIRDYCMEDALATYYLWLTLRHVRGQLTEEKYREAYDGAADAVREARSRTDTYFSS
jgi:hypothetical protein